jgi:hypothetical protein
VLRMNASFAFPVYTYFIDIGCARKYNVLIQRTHSAVEFNVDGSDVLFLVTLLETVMRVRD